MKKAKLTKKTLIFYSKSTSGKYYFETDPTTSTITTTTLTGIFNNVKKLSS
ncbi:hypothetical protein WG904_16110 [Pedobacter sp. Du54]|uniref:hypothetical protein n=1 Tax=Pedobacter anseongensis TaxID=3133439 RepID=UPI00309AA6B8